MGSLRLRSGTSVAPAPTAYATESKTPKLRLIPGLKGQYPCLFNRDQRHHDATRRVLTEPGMRPPVSKAHRMASQIAAVIPSHAMRRVAAIDDEGRGLAAAPVRWRARSFTGPGLNRMIGSPPPGGFLARCLPGQALISIVSSSSIGVATGKNDRRSIPRTQGRRSRLLGRRQGRSRHRHGKELVWRNSQVGRSRPAIRAA